jgi:hypothetical protein
MAITLQKQLLTLTGREGPQSGNCGVYGPSLPMGQYHRITVCSGASLGVYTDGSWQTVSAGSNVVVHPVLEDVRLSASGSKVLVHSSVNSGEV